jgi:hypothetical protein
VLPVRCGPQAAQQAMETALSYSGGGGDAATIRAAIERLDVSDEEEEELV